MTDNKSQTTREIISEFITWFLFMAEGGVGLSIAIGLMAAMITEDGEKSKVHDMLTLLFAMACYVRLLRYGWQKP